MQTLCLPICKAEHCFGTITPTQVIDIQKKWVDHNVPLFIVSEQQSSLHKSMVFDVLGGDVLELMSFIAKCRKEIILLYYVKGCSVKSVPLWKKLSKKRTLLKMNAEQFGRFAESRRQQLTTTSILIMHVSFVRLRKFFGT